MAFLASLTSSLMQINDQCLSFPHSCLSTCLSNTPSNRASSTLSYVHLGIFSIRAVFFLEKRVQRYESCFQVVIELENGQLSAVTFWNSS